MAIIKSYTDIEQSRKLAEILSFDSADMSWVSCDDGRQKYYQAENRKIILMYEKKHWIPCWSLAALFKYLSEIKPQVYTPILFPSKAKWILQFAEHGHGNVCEASCENPVDACCEIILKLKKRHLI